MGRRDGRASGSGWTTSAALVTEPELRTAFWHALVLLVFYSVLPVAIGLLLAAAMARTRVRGLTAFRTMLFLPQVIALVVVAVMWRMIYAPDGGLINEALRAIGLGGLAQNWLGDFNLALPAVGLIATWVMYGLAMVLFTAGVQKIPPSLYDAARVDGAGPGARVLRRHAARAARRDRGRADAHDDRGAAQLRPRLHHDRRRPGRRDHGARVRGLRPRVPVRRGRRRGRRSASASPP